mmetsp:Transcript_11676/g.19831  ORF Transcript_11676/g.19831 Transcript_11676/m.19831 type:complete len:201 (+) Transcript_11676:1173-1775(+)
MIISNSITTCVNSTERRLRKSRFLWGSLPFTLSVLISHSQIKLELAGQIMLWIPAFSFFKKSATNKSCAASAAVLVVMVKVPSKDTMKRKGTRDGRDGRIDFDGVKLGSEDGSVDGADDFEGVALGSGDGLVDSEGSKLGSDDGCEDGDSEGVMDLEGDKLGSEEGTFDGADDVDGDKLESVEDDGLADLDGSKLGSDDG